ncbi:hypothetical protein LCGC14_1821600 [marine sediment metagenome]|uniref:Uncharacterized protein n=1 Tax=marine sediment metagenome TaxID=412755 RepID=A0A0F9H6V1_9ZZZZ
MKKQKGNLSQLIGGAAKLAGLTLNVAPLTRQEREDVTASAALGYVKGSQKGQPERYEFRAAKNEAMKFILNQVFKHGQTSELREGDALDDLGAEVESEFEVDESHLADMFLKHRTKKGGRGCGTPLKETPEFARSLWQVMGMSGLLMNSAYQEVVSADTERTSGKG